MTQVAARRPALDPAKLRAALAPHPATSPVVVLMTRVLGLFAALALWLVLFGLLLSGLVYSHAQSGLYDTFRSQLANGVAPVGGTIAEGAPMAMLSSSAAGLHNVVVVQGSSGRDLRDGPGHYPGTVLPGQAGVSLLLGRATSFGAPFAGIADTHPGDVIKVVTGQGSFTYVVADVRRPGDPLPPTLKAGGSQLTLVTAEGGGWRSGWAPSNAVYVDAVLRGRTALSAPVGLANVRDGVLKRDTRGMYPMVLWLQLLLVAGLGGVWIRSRWGAARAWLLALPVGVAALWGASLSAWLLLPNLL